MNPNQVNHNDDFTAGACRCNGTLHTYGDPSCNDAAGGER